LDELLFSIEFKKLKHTSTPSFEPEREVFHALVLDLRVHPKDSSRNILPLFAQRAPRHTDDNGIPNQIGYDLENEKHGSCDLLKIWDCSSEPAGYEG
jgi:hypothetical protein